MGLLKKAEIEASLQQEQQMIQEGKLKEDNPLDLSATFRRLCDACRRGDLKACQEMITEGANINARDQFDYTPLILASLCGHYELVQLLLESGALCERDTFQGERCLYNALNDKIRNLLLSYDYSKSTDPLQPFAAYITSLLSRGHPRTSDIIVISTDETFHLHKFILSARSPYFQKRLATAPETASWKLPATVPTPAFAIAIQYLYFGEIPNDLGGGPGTGFTEDEILEGIDKISKQLEIRNLWDGILEAGDRRMARQKRQDEVNRGCQQLEFWFRENVLRHKFIVDSSQADQVRWDRQNGIFADVLLQASVEDHATEEDSEKEYRKESDHVKSSERLPIGPFGVSHSRSPSRHRSKGKTTLFPAHRAMLLRSEYFLAMFSSGFREAQDSEYLQIIPVECSPDVLEVVLTFLYTEKTDFPLELAIEVVLTADLLLIEKLKTKAAVVISALGSGSMVQIPRRLDMEASTQDTDIAPGQSQQDELDIYDVIRAGWLTRLPRLEEFGARYIAYRLENYIDEEAFAELVRESAGRIQSRQETDTIELLDDIRYYLSERFRLRFEDVGLEEMLEEAEAEAANNDQTAEQQHLETSNGVHDLQEVPASKTTAFSTGPMATQTTIDDGDDSGEVENATVIRTLDGSIAGDEMEEEARNYQILLEKIDLLLEKLRLDA